MISIPSSFQLEKRRRAPVHRLLARYDHIFITVGCGNVVSGHLPFFGRALFLLGT